MSRTVDACHVRWHDTIHHLCRERGPHLIHICACGASRPTAP